MDVKIECTTPNADDLSIIWENREINIEAIEADAERDVKPDLEELQKLLGSSNPIDTESQIDKHIRNLRSMVLDASKRLIVMEEDLTGSKEQYEQAFNESQSLRKQFQEYQTSNRVDIQKMEDRILSLRLQCDEKLGDVYFQKERYACNMLIEQRKCDLAKDYSRKQKKITSIVKNDISQLQKDIKKEIDLHIESDVNCEALEKDVNMLESMNANMQISLGELEKSGDMAMRLTLEFKENLARKTDHLNQSKQEHHRLLENYKILSKEKNSYLHLRHELDKSETCVVPNNQYDLNRDIKQRDETLKETRDQLKTLESNLQEAQEKIQKYNLEATALIPTKE